MLVTFKVKISAKQAKEWHCLMIFTLGTTREKLLEMEARWVVYDLLCQSIVQNLPIYSRSRSYYHD